MGSRHHHDECHDDEAGVGGGGGDGGGVTSHVLSVEGHIGVSSGPALLAGSVQH